MKIKILKIQAYNNHQYEKEEMRDMKIRMIINKKKVLNLKANQDKALVNKSLIQ